MDNAILQIKIYTRKFLRTLKKESIISIFIGVVITFIVMFVTSEKMFSKFEGTKSGLFSLICVCIWIGIFNSIQLVCREKNDIVKDELDKSLKASSYMAAHFIYQFFLCAIQSVIVFIIFYITMLAGDKGDIGNPLAYLITIFLIMYASDAMAFVISCAVPNPIVAMTVMPLLLLIQLVMAGVLFELDGAAKLVANFTISKWGMSAFGMIGDITMLPSAVRDKLTDIPEKQIAKMQLISPNDTDMFSGGTGKIFLCWLIFILFIAAFYFLSVFALKATTRRIKK